MIDRKFGAERLHERRMGFRESPGSLHFRNAKRSRVRRDGGVSVAGEEAKDVEDEEEDEYAESTGDGGGARLAS